MNTTTALFALAFTAVIAVAEAGGVNGRSVFSFSFVAVMIGISWFFNSRRSKAPTLVEGAAAYAWLVVRRLVGFAGALFFVFAAIMIGFALYQRAVELSFLARLGAAFFMLAMAAFCVWVAVFGQGLRRYDWRDDVALHHENKRRYHWRW